MILIHQGHMLTTTSPEAFTLQAKSWIGEKQNGKIVYMPVEAMFLIETKKAVLVKTKEIPFERALQQIQRYDKNTSITYPVYYDLKKKGHIVKAALKFGGDFRVYQKGTTPETAHAHWIVHATASTTKIEWGSIVAKLRVSHTTKKAILLAIVDKDLSVSYYEMNWQKIV